MDPEKLKELEQEGQSETSYKVKKIQQILHYDGVDVTSEQIERVEATIEDISDDNPQTQPDWAIMCKLYNAYEWVMWSLKSKFYTTNYDDQLTAQDVNQTGEMAQITDVLQELA